MMRIILAVLGLLIACQVEAQNIAGGGGGGGVTSVSGSGGSTGLTLTGGPITGAGTLTLGGTLAAANGGTGLTSLGTGVATALGIAIGSAGAPVVLNGVGGTPSSLTGTNITGTASGLTAGNVTTNHSITVSGDCTGSGTNSIALTCSGGGGTGANPTATAGPTAVNGVATTFLRSDGAPAIQLATSAQKGIAQVDGQTIVAASGVISTAAPIRTAATPTVATTDMGGTIFVSSGTITIPAITTNLFDAKQTLLLVNYSGSTEAISTTPTINAGGNCVSGTGIPAGYAWAIQSNNTSLDCIQIATGIAPTLAGNNTFTGTQTFGSVVGAVNIQAGTTYTLAATDCGKTVQVSNGSAITVTTFQAAVVGCVINVVQGGAGQITFANGGSATLVSAHSYTKTFNAAGASVSLSVYVNAGAAAVFTLTGDGA